jgi:PPM family protein phosphatase
MVVLHVAHRVQASEKDQDRVEVLRLEDATILLVADGSGGISGGAQAAERALHEISVAARCSNLSEQASWLAILAGADGALCRDPGQSAILAMAIVRGRIFGASVGDCEAWLITKESVVELTASQVRKPLLGSGEAVPVAFEAVLGDATLLLATDGLLNYAGRNRIVAVALGSDLQMAAYALADLPRLRSGALPDDVAVVLCRS